MAEVERSRGAATPSAGSSGTAKASINTNINNEDVASLSTGQDAVSTLGAQLSAVPDVRQALVDGLKQSISSGTYKVSPDGIADKMISDRVA